MIVKYWPIIMALLVFGGCLQVEKMANPSGTGRANAFMRVLQFQGGGTITGAAVGGLPGALAGFAAPLVAPHIAARLMTNPGFIRWLSRGVDILPTNYNSMAGHVGRLVALANAEPAIAEEIYQYASALRSSVSSPQPQETQTQKPPAQ